MKTDIPYVRKLREELVQAVARAGGAKSTTAWGLSRPVANVVTALVVAGAVGAGLFIGSLNRLAPSGEGGVPQRQAGRCVEQFTAGNLSRREFGFDGTITKIIPPSDIEAEGPAAATKVVFDVHKWYKGGSGSTVTLLTYVVPGPVNPGAVNSGQNPPVEVGARILASGNDVFLWGCGFSRPYTAEDAGLFARTFGD